MEENIFDSHAQLNHFMVYEGARISTPAIRPSVYISCLKLKKAFKSFTDIEIEDLFNEEMGVLGIKKHREKLEDMLDDLQDWQLFYALYLLINEEGALEAAKFIITAKWDDRSPFKDEYELYEMICKK